MTRWLAGLPLGAQLWLLALTIICLGGSLML